MIVLIKSSFQKDTKKLRPEIQKEIFSIIEDLHIAKALLEISHCKKLTGYRNAYRIRFGDYRIGFFYVNNKIELIRVLDRKNIYRYFPQ